MLTYDSPFLMAIICCRNFSITDFEHIFILILIKHCKINVVTTITYVVRYIFLLELNLSVFVHLVISLDHISCRLYTEEYYLNEMQSEGIPEMQAVIFYLSM